MNFTDFIQSLCLSRLRTQTCFRLSIDDLHDGVIWLQLPESFTLLFLMLIRTIVIETPLGIQNSNSKEKTKGTLLVVVKWRQRANLGMLFSSTAFTIQYATVWLKFFWMFFFLLALVESNGDLFIFFWRGKGRFFFSEGSWGVRGLQPLLLDRHFPRTVLLLKPRPRHPRLSEKPFWCPAFLFQTRETTASKTLLWKWGKRFDWWGIGTEGRKRKNKEQCDSDWPHN